MTMSIALSAEVARRMTDEAKEVTHLLWRKMVALYEGDAHVALGYGSWGDYCGAEFDMSSARAYQLLDAGRVSDMLASSTTVELVPRNEAVARELAPFRDDLDAARAAMATAVEIHGPDPTAADVRDIVRLPTVVEMPPAPPPHDLRFELIEDAVATLRLMPVADKILWPVDELGDVEAVDEALAWLHAWLPKAERSWRAHKALVCAARRQERDAKHGLRAA